MGIDTPVVAALIAAAVSAITGIATSRQTLERLRREFLLNMQAEALAKKLRQNPKWRFRAFKTLNYHIAGFEDDELRRVLIRAGAVRLADAQGVEICGLLERMEDRPKGEYGTTVN